MIRNIVSFYGSSQGNSCVPELNESGQWVGRIQMLTLK